MNDPVQVRNHKEMLKKFQVEEFGAKDKNYESQKILDMSANTLEEEASQNATELADFRTVQAHRAVLNDHKVNPLRLEAQLRDRDISLIPKEEPTNALTEFEDEPQVHDHKTKLMKFNIKAEPVVKTKQFEEEITPNVTEIDESKIRNAHQNILQNFKIERLKQENDEDDHDRDETYLFEEKSKEVSQMVDNRGEKNHREVLRDFNIEPIQSRRETIIAEEKTANISEIHNQTQKNLHKEVLKDFGIDQELQNDQDITEIEEEKTLNISDLVHSQEKSEHLAALKNVRVDKEIQKNEKECTMLEEEASITISEQQDRAKKDTHKEILKEFLIESQPLKLKKMSSIEDIYEEKTVALTELEGPSVIQNHRGMLLNYQIDEQRLGNDGDHDIKEEKTANNSEIRNPKKNKFHREALQSYKIEPLTPKNQVKSKLPLKEDKGSNKILPKDILGKKSGFDSKMEELQEESSMAVTDMLDSFKLNLNRSVLRRYKVQGDKRTDDVRLLLERRSAQKKEREKKASDALNRSVRTSSVKRESSQMAAKDFEFPQPPSRQLEFKREKSDDEKRMTEPSPTGPVPKRPVQPRPAKQNDIGKKTANDRREETVKDSPVMGHDRHDGSKNPKQNVVHPDEASAKAVVGERLDVEEIKRLMDRPMTETESREGHDDHSGEASFKPIKIRQVRHPSLADAQPLTKFNDHQDDLLEDPEPEGNSFDYAGLKKGRPAPTDDLRSFIPAGYSVRRQPAESHLMADKQPVKSTVKPKATQQQPTQGREKSGVDKWELEAEFNRRSKALAEAHRQVKDNPGAVRPRRSSRHPSFKADDSDYYDFQPFDDDTFDRGRGSILMQSIDAGTVIPQARPADDNHSTTNVQLLADLIAFDAPANRPPVKRDKPAADVKDARPARLKANLINKPKLPDDKIDFLPSPTAAKTRQVQGATEKKARVLPNIYVKANQDFKDDDDGRGDQRYGRRRETGDDEPRPTDIRQIMLEKAGLR